MEDEIDLDFVFVFPGEAHKTKISAMFAGIKAAIKNLPPGDDLAGIECSVFRHGDGRQDVSVTLIAWRKRDTT